VKNERPKGQGGKTVERGDDTEKMKQYNLKLMEQLLMLPNDGIVWTVLMFPVEGRFRAGMN
jgi:hypothetical protein